MARTQFWKDEALKKAWTNWRKKLKKNCEKLRKSWKTWWSTQGTGKVVAAYCILHQLGPAAIFCIIQHTCRHCLILQTLPTTQWLQHIWENHTILAAYCPTLDRVHSSANHSIQCNVAMYLQHIAPPWTEWTGEAGSCWSANPCYSSANILTAREGRR